jgi:prevent-host-death family protein
MSETGAAPARVGVRELRQNLSVYLRRVQAGESFEVTDHGHAVARLSPRVPETLSPLERLLAEGRASPAAGDLLALGPPIKPAPGAPRLSDVLERMREDERW